MILSYTQTFIQQNEHCNCLILGHVPLIKFKCILTGIQLRTCCPRAETTARLFVFAILLFKESLDI